jgi:hypothetical protein
MKTNKWITSTENHYGHILEIYAREILEKNEISAFFTTKTSEK